MSELTKGKVRIYAAGGGGINIARWYNDAGETFGIASVHTTMIDTSHSNFEDNDPMENRFLITGSRDGSGKERAVNVEPILKDIPRLLNEHQPMDLNIVIHTSSGGTGSVAGFLIAKELLARGQQVVVVLIGTHESGKAASNSRKTWASYDDAAQQLERSIPISWISYPTRKDADRSARDVISALLFLASRQNREFDTMDLQNFLNFTRTTTKTPSLGLMRLYLDPKQVDSSERNILTMASLYKSPDDPKPTVFAPDTWDGYYREAITEPVNNLHMVISTSGLPEILNELEEYSKRVDQLNQSALDAPRFARGNNDTVTSGGVVI